MIEDVMNDLANEMQLRKRDNEIAYENEEEQEEDYNWNEYDAYLEQCNDDAGAEEYFDNFE